MSSQENESRLVYEIMQTVGKLGAVYRTNAGRIRLPNGATFHGLPKGFADIMAIFPGPRIAFIECKIKGNTPTPEQAAFLERMRGMGCMAGVAFSVDDALQICGFTK